MDDARIDALIQELDASVAKEGAELRFLVGENHLHESAVVGNRAGYLRMAAELLRGAVAPTGYSREIDVDIDYLYQDSDIRFREFIREVDAPRQVLSPPPWRSRLATLAQMLVLLLLFGCLLVGVVTVVKWLF